MFITLPSGAHPRALYIAWSADCLILTGNKPEITLSFAQSSLQFFTVLLQMAYLAVPFLQLEPVMLFELLHQLSIIIGSFVFLFVTWLAI